MEKAAVSEPGEVKTSRRQYCCVHCLHITIYLVIFIAGLITCVSLGTVLRNFKGKCVLYTDMQFSMEDNNTLLVDYERTKWAHSGVCLYSTYVSVCASIFTFIWGWFYIFFTRKRSASTWKPSDVRLMFPSILFNFIFFVATLVSSCYISAGVTVWCESMARGGNREKMTCLQSSKLWWENAYGGHKSYPLLALAETSSWILVGALATISFVSVCRFYHYRTRKQMQRVLNEVNLAFIEDTAQEFKEEIPAAMDQQQQIQFNNVHQEPVSQQGGLGESYVHHSIDGVTVHVPEHCGTQAVEGKGASHTGSSTT